VRERESSVTIGLTNINEILSLMIHE